jgi:2,3-bisphosphoglycerate-independent phosphoglycerate mutase
MILKKERVERPAVLVIMDGFGLKEKAKDNAIANAKTPCLDRLFSTCSWVRLDPSGEAVGLPRHQMGTSEVGHLNIGAGRVVYQDLVRINNAIKDGSFFDNSALVAAVAEAKRPGSALHLLGLCSDGGVHSHLNHLFALMELAKREKIKHLFIHAITDGRDTPPRIAKTFMQKIEKKCKELELGEIATVSGRYYAMDRDGRWERERKAYDSLVNDVGPRFSSAAEAIDAGYSRDEGDEFIIPSIVETKDARTSRIINGDSVIFFNFRQDRARQLSHGFTDTHFAKFRRKRLHLRFTTMTSYDDSLHVIVAFPPENVQMGMAEWLSKHRVRQFHTAETEKYAHVTYFFNGGREQPFRDEHRAMVPSPKIATYDLQPEMSAPKVLEGVLDALRSGLYGFIVVNFANADMVGHTGKHDATVKAVEMIDKAVSAIETEVENQGAVMLVTADHGNAEEMSGKYQTSHTLNNVPLILVDPRDEFVLKPMKGVGKLCDIAPTLLTMMGLPLSPEMSGKILVKKKK